MNPRLSHSGILRSRCEGRELEIIARDHGDALLQQLRQHAPESLTTEALTLEEIFLATLQ